MMRNNSSKTSFESSNSSRVGPRAKCDQVVYEAIAKAAEIIVRSRCNIPPASVNANTSNKPSGGSGSRFNIEVAEVEQVRSILQRWRRSLHVPLRLDVFYQQDDNSSVPPRRKLLERWCIDYVASEALASNNGNNVTPADPAADTIAQLRHVCKKVVILLRTLHCLARMLPTYKLHRRLSSSSSQRNDSFHSQSAGFYQHNQNGNPVDISPGGGAINSGTIGFSFYASGSHNDVSVTGPLQRDMDDTSSFMRQNIAPVSTPYGILHICALYAPNPLPRISPTAPIAIAGAQTKVTDHAPHPLRHQQAHERREFRDEGYAAGEIDSRERAPELRRQPQSCMVSDFIIQDYAENRKELKPSGGEDGVGDALVKQKKEREGENQDTNEKRVMSGLSLALMNECKVNDKNRNGSVDERLESENADNGGTASHVPCPTPTGYHRSPVPAAAFPRSLPKRMNSMDEGAMRWGEDNWGGGRGSRAAPCEQRGRAMTAETSMNSTGRNIFSNALSSSPKHYLLSHRNNRQRSHRLSLRKGQGAAAVDGSPRPGEYGYGYNNINIPQNGDKANTQVPPFVRSDSRRLSPPQPPGSTPPFSQSPNAIGSLDTKVSPKDISSSPPFHSHPLSLHQNPEINNRIMAFAHQQRQWGQGYEDARSPNLDGILLPPSSLEVLQTSPFKTVANAENSLVSSLSMAVPPTPSLAGATSQGGGPFTNVYDDAPFVGSFCSTSPSAGPFSSRSLYNNSATSVSFDKNEMEPYEEMPFADSSACVDSSYSVHDGDASEVSSFAHRCATASRLQLFDKDKSSISQSNVNQSAEGKGTTTETMIRSSQSETHSSTQQNADAVQKEVLKNVQQYNDDLASQLAEFHSFGASIANLQRSSHQSMVATNGSVTTDSASATATSVA